MATTRSSKTLTDKLAKNPNDPNAYYRRGQVYASKGAYGLSMNDFSDTLRLNAKDVEAFDDRCWARTVIGELQTCVEGFTTEALRLAPTLSMPSIAAAC